MNKYSDLHELQEYNDNEEDESSNSESSSNEVYNFLLYSGIAFYLIKLGYLYLVLISFSCICITSLS